MALSRFPRIPWQFWLPLVMQVALILAAPARSMYTYNMGESVLLQTAPVDPYDLLRGYYVILSYQISRPDTLDDLPGWEDIEAAQNQRSLPVYVVLDPPSGKAISEVEGKGQPWLPVRISRDRPTLDPDQVALKGLYHWGSLTYGLERYYIPEDQRVEINERINQLQRSQPESYLVEVKIDGAGEAVLVSLWIGEKNYRF